MLYICTISFRNSFSKNNLRRKREGRVCGFKTEFFSSENVISLGRKYFFLSWLQILRFLFRFESWLVHTVKIISSKAAYNSLLFCLPRPLVTYNIYLNNSAGFFYYIHLTKNMNNMYNNLILWMRHILFKLEIV